MTFDTSNLKAILFDYGNTLVEFTAPHVAHLNAAIGSALHDRFGPFDEQRYIELRTKAYRAPYFHPDLREPPLSELLTDLVQQLHAVDPSPQQIADLDAIHHEAFVAIVEAPDYLLDLLDRLRERYTLALISNYPCPRSIRRSLERTGIAEHMDTVVVSGDVGHVKPHPLLFEQTLDKLGLQPHEAIYIGDNWLGDIQGAKRLGMAAVHICQFDTLEVFDREDGHHDADFTITHLTELEKWLIDD